MTTEPSDLSRKLIEAWQHVQEAELPEHVQPTALALTFEALQQGNQGRPAWQESTSESGNPPSADSESLVPSTPAATPATPSQSDFFGQLSRMSDVDTKRLQRVFVLHDGKIELVISNRSLGSDSATRFRTVAVLMVPALMALESVDVVDGASVKKAGESYGATDPSGNFAKYVSGIADYSYVGARNKKAFRVSPGWEDTFADTVNEVLGESG